MHKLSIHTMLRERNALIQAQIKLQKIILINQKVYVSYFGKIKVIN